MNVLENSAFVAAFSFAGLCQAQLADSQVSATEPVQVALAPAGALPALRPWLRVTPVYPRVELTGTAGVTRLQAQLTIDAGGQVQAVKFADWHHATMANYGKSASKALRQWRFPAGDANRGYEVELVFREE